MRITTDFLVAAQASEVHATLADPRLVVGCVPGASLQPQDDQHPETWPASLEVRIGPASMSYQGVVTVVESDRDAGLLRYRATGSDRRGRGGGEAEIELIVADDPGGAKVSVVADLSLSGIVAQFGRGMIEEVTEVMIGDFARSLEAKLNGAGGAAPKRRGAGSLLLRSLGRRLRRVFSRQGRR